MRFVPNSVSCLQDIPSSCAPLLHHCTRDSLEVLKVALGISEGGGGFLFFKWA